MQIDLRFFPGTSILLNEQIGEKTLQKLPYGSNAGIDTEEKGSDKAFKFT